jgi:hypothetical protein
MNNVPHRYEDKGLRGARTLRQRYPPLRFNQDSETSFSTCMHPLIQLYLSWKQDLRLFDMLHHLLLGPGSTLMTVGAPRPAALGDRLISK